MDTEQEIAYLKKSISEQDNEIDRMRVRIEKLEHANLDVLAFRDWQASQKGKQKKRK